MNRTVSILIIVICAVLFGVGTLWYVQTRPKPMTEYVPPSGSNPFPQPVGSSVPTTSPIQQSETSDAPADSRSWGERLSDTKLPDLGNVKLKMYTNAEYGFTLQYPEKWEIRDSSVKVSGADTVFFFYDSNSDDKPLRLNIAKGTVRDRFMSSTDGMKRIQKYGLVPDARINEIDMYIEYPHVSAEQAVMSVYFEKNGFIFSINETFDAASNQDHKITEYIIKSFRFLK